MRILYIVLLLVGIHSAKSQIDGNLLLGLTTVTDEEMNSIENPIIGSVLYNTSRNAIFGFSGTDWNEVLGAGVGWNINGNNNVNPITDFLGTINDVKMEIRSNNLPMLQFGRRQTLGLVQNYPDYLDPDQPLVYINGDGLTSAIQFAAAGASFYQPMFFTTPNGSFRLKGSTGITDFFEIGSAGPANDGRLEFIIADDGAEPIIFKRYDYRLGQFHTELFRVQGSNNSANAKPRFGININPQQVPVDIEYDDASTSYNIANSTFQVNGSVSKSIQTTTGNLTLSEDHHTIIIGGSHDITLPNATSCNGRIYVIKNVQNSNRSISTYINASGVNDTQIYAHDVLWLQSDGSNWQQLSETTTSTATIVSSDSNNSITTGSDGGAFLNQNISTTTIQVDRSFLWAGSVNDTDIHANGTLTVNQNRADTGWSFAGPSTISYLGSPDYVEIDLMAVANNTGNHWAHPHIKVFRNGVEIGEGSGLHMDDSGSYSGRTTTTISMVDSAPGTNPVYTFTTLEDDSRTMNNPTIVSLSPVSLIAIEKVDVVVSVAN